jgi:uncharacterized protein (AIM24 family)
MPRTIPGVPPPFDQGIFLMHYNRGREAFQEGRYAEARRELESAQRLRPDDADVLNLLGLVYFKTNSFPEAEVIYRRLVKENSDVFILHSNLGLILFKQGKTDEAEQFLLRSVALRPNYSKSHLYLGLLYRQRRKFGLALEHLRFAGAEKMVRELEEEMRSSRSEAPPQPRPPESGRAETTARIENRTADLEAPFVEWEPATSSPPPRAPQAPAQSESEQKSSASRKLQDAVDEPIQGEQPRIDLGKTMEGASKTFALHENGFLEILSTRSVYVKRGTVSSYSGNLKFEAESGLLGTTAATMVKVVGAGKIFVFERGRRAFLLDLHDEFIYVEGSNLLAMEDSLTFRVEPIYDSNYQRKIDTLKIFGRGSLAISTSIEPLTMRVTPDLPLSISANALVAWTGPLVANVLDDATLEDVMIEGDEDSFRIRFEGEGVVVAER